MKKIAFLLMGISIIFLFSGCGRSNNMFSNEDIEELSEKELEGGMNTSEADRQDIHIEANNAEDKLYIRVNESTISVTFAENSSVDALKEQLEKGDITINAVDYNKFEKYGSLGFSLPQNDVQLTTKAGDVMLYNGDNFTIYYDTNTWSLTRIGTVDNLSQQELKEILGEGDVTMTLSLSNKIK